ncbi:MAG: hypothetical protein OQK04_19260 [Kangiellaceae bacterium]|nr:hypothetical protein [Kangiellaceae bacterium]MCW9000858.1 hypothetical protein [Kangiellaceae bacterium]
MDWITDSIAVGNFVDAKNLKEGDVDAVLYLIENCCSIDEARFDVESRRREKSTYLPVLRRSWVYEP